MSNQFKFYLAMYIGSMILVVLAMAVRYILLCRKAGRRVNVKYCLFRYESWTGSTDLHTVGLIAVAVNIYFFAMLLISAIYRIL